MKIAALRSYFSAALKRFPQLEFKHMLTFAGVRTVTIVYGSVNGLTAAETMELCADGKVLRTFAQYSATPQ
jgi:hypothetical protein